MTRPPYTGQICKSSNCLGSLEKSYLDALHCKIKCGCWREEEGHGWWWWQEWLSPCSTGAQHVAPPPGTGYTGSPPWPPAGLQSLDSYGPNSEALVGRLGPSKARPPHVPVSKAAPLGWPYRHDLHFRPPRLSSQSDGLGKRAKAKKQWVGGLLHGEMEYSGDKKKIARGRNMKVKNKK
jgi:hypothetical protein